MEERSRPQKKRDPANEEGETVAGLPRYHTHTTIFVRIPRAFYYLVMSGVVFVVHHSSGGGLLISS